MFNMAQCAESANVNHEIHQQLQFLRDAGYLTFASRGCYKLTHS